MSLGRGLESLIPKKDPASSASEDGTNAGSFDSAQDKQPRKDESAQNADSSSSIPADERSQQNEEDGTTSQNSTAEPQTTQVSQDQGRSSENPSRHVPDSGEQEKNTTDPGESIGNNTGGEDASANSTVSRDPHVRHAPALTRRGRPDRTRQKQQPRSVFYIEVEKIKPNPHQPRREFSEEGLEALASSIQKHGILQPLTVTKHEIKREYGRGVEYHIIAGERRWRAAQMAGFSQVPVIVREATEQNKLELALIENIQRDDLNPVEEARAYQKLAQKFELTQQAIAEQVGKSRAAVANKMRLLGLPYDIQQLLSTNNNLTEGHAKVILSLDNPEKQTYFAKKVLEEDLSVRALDRLIKKESQPKNASSHKTQSSPDPELEAYKKKIQESLGASVAISGNRQKGRLAISFHSPEELRAIIGRLIEEETRE